jgi:hypothetical protein
MDNNNIHKELISMLKELTDCIVGDWFLSDGGLLGITRENKLIDWDYDLDLYLLPNSYIDKNKLSKTSLKYYKYYCCIKIYREENEKIKKNSWNDYLLYLRTTEFLHKKINKCQLMKEGKKTYSENKKDIKFTFPFIDIMYLQKKETDNGIIYKIKSKCWQEYFYKEEEINNLKIYNLQDINIKIPTNPYRILEMLYGKDWKIPNKNYTYF